MYFLRSLNRLGCSNGMWDSRCRLVKSQLQDSGDLKGKKKTKTEANSMESEKKKQQIVIACFMRVMRRNLDS